MVWIFKDSLPLANCIFCSFFDCLCCICKLDPGNSQVVNESFELIKLGAKLFLGFDIYFGQGHLLQHIEHLLEDGFSPLFVGFVSVHQVCDQSLQTALLIHNYHCWEHYLLEYPDVPIIFEKHSKKGFFEEVLKHWATLFLAKLLYASN